jgi:hypothetical protein
LVCADSSNEQDEYERGIGGGRLFFGAINIGAGLVGFFATVVVVAVGDLFLVYGVSRFGFEKSTGAEILFFKLAVRRVCDVTNGVSLFFIVIIEFCA